VCCFSLDVHCAAVCSMFLSSGRDGSSFLSSDSAVVNALSHHDTLFMPQCSGAQVEVGQLVKGWFRDSWRPIIPWRSATLLDGVPSLPLRDVPAEWIGKEICLTVRRSGAGPVDAKSSYRVVLTGGFQRHTASLA
jgi:hypothetical protein